MRSYLSRLKNVSTWIHNSWDWLIVEQSTSLVCCIEGSALFNCVFLSWDQPLFLISKPFLLGFWKILSFHPQMIHLNLAMERREHRRSCKRQDGASMSNSETSLLADLCEPDSSISIPH